MAIGRRRLNGLYIFAFLTLANFHTAAAYEGGRH
jgi:hypothetical protein